MHISAAWQSFCTFLSNISEERRQIGGERFTQSSHTIRYKCSAGFGLGRAGRHPKMLEVLENSREGFYTQDPSRGTNGLHFHSLLFGYFPQLKKCRACDYDFRKTHYLILQFEQTKKALVFSLKCTAQVSSKVCALKKFLRLLF